MQLFGMVDHDGNGWMEVEARAVGASYIRDFAGRRAHTQRDVRFGRSCAVGEKQRSVRKNHKQLAADRRGNDNYRSAVVGRFQDRIRKVDLRLADNGGGLPREDQRLSLDSSQREWRI